MAGIRIGGRAVLPTGVIPMTLYSLEDIGGFDVTAAAVYVMNDPGLPPVVVSGFYEVTVDDTLTDPVANQSGTMIVFATTPEDAGPSELRSLDPVTPGSTDVGALLDTNPSTLVVSMQPSWCPNDEDLVVYRTIDDSPNECEIRSVVPSVGSSSVTTLRTISRTTNGNVYRPSYNHDGTLIAYGLSSTKTLNVMAADGSGSPTVVATLTGGNTWEGGWDYAWSPVADELVYQDISGTFPTGDTLFKKVNADGTGTTTLYTDPDTYWGLTLYPWSPDGSTIYYFARDTGGSGATAFELYAIDAAGGGAAAVSPTRNSWGNVNDDLAYVFGDRVYWYADQFTDDGEVVSCALDGSDLRTEFSVTSTPSVGDIENFTSGFYYRLGNPQ